MRDIELEIFKTNPDPVPASTAPDFQCLRDVIDQSVNSNTHCWAARGRLSQTQVIKKENSPPRL